MAFRHTSGRRACNKPKRFAHVNDGSNPLTHPEGAVPCADNRLPVIGNDQPIIKVGVELTIVILACIEPETCHKVSKKASGRASLRYATKMVTVKYPVCGGIVQEELSLQLGVQVEKRTGLTNAEPITNCFCHGKVHTVEKI